MRRELAEWAQQAHDLSQWHAAGLIPVNRATLRYSFPGRVMKRETPAITG
jgi:hypothetical protein